MNVLVKVGMLLLILSILYGMYIIYSFNSTKYGSSIIIDSYSFVNKGYLDQDKIKSILIKGKEKYKIKQAKRKRIDLIKNISQWLCFFLSSIITIFAGFQGKILSNFNLLNDIELKEIGGNSKRYIRIIGILAGCIAILTALESRLIIESEKYRNSAQEIFQSIKEFKIDIDDAKNLKEADAIFDIFEFNMDN